VLQNEIGIYMMYDKRKPVIEEMMKRLNYRPTIAKTADL